MTPRSCTVAIQIGGAPAVDVTDSIENFQYEDCIDNNGGPAEVVDFRLNDKNGRAGSLAGSATPALSSDASGHPENRSSADG
jgi:hypothetical protein